VSVFWKLGKNFLISTSGDSENEGTPHTSTEDTEQNPSDPSR
jgi:hypothetical protein